MQHDQLVLLTDLVDSLRREGVEGLLAEVGGDPAEAAIHLAAMAAGILPLEQRMQLAAHLPDLAHGIWSGL